MFPECVARVPVSLWGCGGRAVFAGRCVYVRNRPQPFATVRNRPQPFASVLVRSVWHRKFCKRVYFWSFPALRSFISRGRRGTLWRFNMFHDVSKVVLRGRRNTFATLSKDVLYFPWQAQHFGHLWSHFAWQAQHFGRLVLRVFLSALREVVTRCKFCGRRGILWQVIKPRTKRWFGGQFVRKHVGKCRFWSCEVWKLLCAYGKSRKNVSFSMCHKMCSCRFAWHAWHFVTFHVCEVQVCREAEVAVPMGKVAKSLSFSTCHKMCSCRFAWHTWHFVTFHVCEVQVCHEAKVAVPMGKVAKKCHKMCSCCFAWQA